MQIVWWGAMGKKFFIFLLEMIHWFIENVWHTETATWGVLSKNVFLEISQNSDKKEKFRKIQIKNFDKKETLCQSLFFIKVAGLRPTILFKKRLRHRCFPVNFAKFLRTPFSQNTSGRLLLDILKSSMPGVH